MALKDIYIKAIGQVIDGTLSKDELWEVFSEHLNDKYRENERLDNELFSLNKKYMKLLELVNDAHKEHKKLYPDE